MQPSSDSTLAHRKKEKTKNEWIYAQEIGVTQNKKNRDFARILEQTQRKSLQLQRN